MYHRGTLKHICATCQKLYLSTHKCSRKSRRPDFAEWELSIAVVPRAPSGLRIVEGVVHMNMAALSASHTNQPNYNPPPDISKMTGALLDTSKSRPNDFTHLAASEAHVHPMINRGIPNHGIEEAHRRSVVMRLCGDIDGSDRVIQECLESHRPDPQSVEYAALCTSQANNCIYRFNFEEAHSQLQNSCPKSIVTQEQDKLLWNQILCAGRALRGQGDFKSARAMFEACWNTPGLPYSKCFIAGSALADVLCELAADKVDEKGSAYLAEMQVWIQAQLDFIGSSGRYRKGHRRLMLSLIEIEILNGQYDHARQHTSGLLGLYNELERPDIIDQLGHIRALMALARLSLTRPDNLERWKDIMDWGILYNPHDEHVFSCGVIYLFLTSVSFTRGKTDESRWYRARALHILQEKRPQYLIPGIGTYLWRQAWDLYSRCHFQ